MRLYCSLFEGVADGVAPEQQEMGQEERWPWLRTYSFQTGKFLGNGVSLLAENVDEEEHDDNDDRRADAEHEDAPTREPSLVMATATVKIGRAHV